MSVQMEPPALLVISDTMSPPIAPHAQQDTTPMPLISSTAGPAASSATANSAAQPPFAPFVPLATLSLFAIPVQWGTSIPTAQHATWDTISTLDIVVLAT